jgi:hypothetical protein
VEPIYNKRGRVVAWHNDTDIYNLNGTHAAVVNGEDVYGHRGQHLGVFEDGLFRDHSGGVVAFKSGATGGSPILPIASIPPIPPIPSIPPIPAIPRIPPIPAIPKLGWGLEWPVFISG